MGFKKYLVKDVMTRKPVTISPLSTVQEAAFLMHKNDIGSLLVFDNNYLYGIITEYDLVRKAILPAIDVKNTKVKDIMVKDLITISPNMDIIDAIKLMKESDIRHTPVMDNRIFVGFLTMKDIIRIQPQLIDIIVDHYELKNIRNRTLRTMGEEEEY